MRDAFSHFTRPFLWPYLIFGGCTVISGIILFLIPFLQPKKHNENYLETYCENSQSEKGQSSDKKQERL